MSKEHSAVVFMGIHSELILPMQNLEVDVPDVIIWFSGWYSGNVGLLGLISKSKLSNLEVHDQKGIKKQIYKWTEIDS